YEPPTVPTLDPSVVFACRAGADTAAHEAELRNAQTVSTRVPKTRRALRALLGALALAISAGVGASGTVFVLENARASSTAAGAVTAALEATVARELP